MYFSCGQILNKILLFLILLFASELSLLPVFQARAVNQQNLLKMVSYFILENCDVCRELPIYVHFK